MENPLHRYQLESNGIEGIDEVRAGEVEALEQFLGQRVITIENLTEYGLACESRCALRDKPFMDVIIGNHRPHRGGPEIPGALRLLLDMAKLRDPRDAYRVHIAYETLHPFMDGNGRTGRALFLWQELKARRERVLEIGFRTEWYYRSLECSR